MSASKKSIPGIRLISYINGENKALLPKFDCDVIKLWSYLWVLAVYKPTPDAENRSVSLNRIYTHFLECFGANRDALTLGLFGTEFRQWVRDGHLQFKVKKTGKGSLVMYKGIDEIILNEIFQH